MKSLPGLENGTATGNRKRPPPNGLAPASMPAVPPAYHAPSWLVSPKTTSCVTGPAPPVTVIASLPPPPWMTVRVTRSSTLTSVPSTLSWSVPRPSSRLSRSNSVRPVCGVAERDPGRTGPRQARRRQRARGVGAAAVVVDVEDVDLLVLRRLRRRRPERPVELARPLDRHDQRASRAGPTDRRERPGDVRQDVRDDREHDVRPEHLDDVARDVDRVAPEAAVHRRGGAGVRGLDVDVVVGLHGVDDEDLEVGPEDVVAGTDDAQAVDGDGVVALGADDEEVVDPDPAVDGDRRLDDVLAGVEVDEAADGEVVVAGRTVQRQRGLVVVDGEVVVAVAAVDRQREAVAGAQPAVGDVVRDREGVAHRRDRRAVARQAEQLTDLERVVAGAAIDRRDRAGVVGGDGVVAGQAEQAQQAVDAPAVGAVVVVDALLVERGGVAVGQAQRGERGVEQVDERRVLRGLVGDGQDPPQQEDVVGVVSAPDGQVVAVVRRRCRAR